MRVAKRLLFVVAAITVAALPAGVGATEPADRLVAIYRGERIPVAHVGRYHCHDLRYPIFECLPSAHALERRVARLQRDFAAARRADGSTATLDILATNYVRVFEHASYLGASAYFSINYDDLRLIGWNDKISSYYGVNSGSGTFFEHVLYGGFAEHFCCNVGVTNVGSGHNDRFSSVKGSA